MAYPKKLGIFVRIPEPGRVKTRLVPPLTPEEACDLYTAFLRDLFGRLSKLKKMTRVVFYAGGDPAALRDIVPRDWPLVPQHGKSLGERMANAFRLLLEAGAATVALIGSDSPDLPLAYVKRAFGRLRHKDLVLGPSSDGGYYLIGMKAMLDPVFQGMSWGEPTVLHDTLARAKREGWSCSLLPVWYDVDTPAGLALLESMVLGREIARSDRLHHTERVIARLRKRR